MTTQTTLEPIRHRPYFNLGGVAYSTAANIGEVNVHFYRTSFQYDSRGRLARTVSPQGTIYRTVYDGQGRAVSEWVGTDDTPSAGYWSPDNLAGTNMVKVREYEYDDGGVGDGNLTTVTEFPGGGAAQHVTRTWYDWRNRAVATKSGVEDSEGTDVNRPLTYFDYDNLGRVTKTRVYDADDETPAVTDGVPQPLDGELLRAQTTTSYDELGRVYRNDVYRVDPSDGEVAEDTLSSLMWYDAHGQVMKSVSPGGLVRKLAYDGVGRLTFAYLTDGGGDAGYADAGTVDGDTVLEQNETKYDKDSNVTETIQRQRFHDAVGTGELGDPTEGIRARVYYAGYYYDAVSGRLLTSVNVGTNEGTEWEYDPGEIPERGDDTLVTDYGYAADALQAVRLTGNPTGGTFTLSFGGDTTSAIAYNASAGTVQSALEALTSIDTDEVFVTARAGGGWEVRFTEALGGSYQKQITANGSGLTGGTAPSVKVRTLSLGDDTGQVVDVTDPMGIVSRTYVDPLGRAVRTIEDFTDGIITDDSNKTVDYAYNSVGMTALQAHLTGGGVQQTKWVYGVKRWSGSGITSKDVVRATRWPHPSTGKATAGEQETVTVNALGQTRTTKDRNGTKHTLTYDVLGRIIKDEVTCFGGGVDETAVRIETAYDGQGNAALITSYGDGNAVINQVKREFNGLGQLIAEWQEHDGEVDEFTPKVEYTYSEMDGGANHSRLTSIKYPSTYTVSYNYSVGINNTISRLSSLSDGDTLEAYDYLGLGTVVRRAHPEPEVDLTYIGSLGDGGDQYAGLDRFGRIVDHLWEDTGTPGVVSQFLYGYDRNSNRLYRDDAVKPEFGELYGYDAFNQLTGFQRGELNAEKNGLEDVAVRSQNWNYDALGNWDSVTTNGTPQTRTANAQNEITSISGATTPTYDANGNMTRAETGLRYVYDAWNRLVAVKNSAGDTTLKTYTYDGLNRRVTEDAGTLIDLYYSNQWQVLEEAVSGVTTKRYVWSPVYMDAMVLRDRATVTPGTLNERLWVMQDANWNVVALTDGSGDVVERFVYDPFGVATVLKDDYDVKGGGSGHEWVYSHQGGRYDPVSGLYYFRMRDYSATLGRFTSLDPIRFAGGDVNLYRYVGNRPGTALDPNGLAESKLHGIAVLTEWQNSLKIGNFGKDNPFPTVFGGGEFVTWFGNAITAGAAAPSKLMLWATLQLMKPKGIIISASGDDDSREAGCCKLGKVTAKIVDGQSAGKIDLGKGIPLGKVFGVVIPTVSTISYKLTVDSVSKYTTVNKRDQADTTITMTLEIEAGPFSGTYHHTIGPIQVICGTDAYIKGFEPPTPKKK